jgi:tetratricopeptide (TPR) repeat protein
MGSVYKCLDRIDDRVVALKVLRPDAAASFGTLEAEIRTLAKLQHENIVRLVDVGSIDGRLYFTMEWLDGDPLASGGIGVRLELEGIHALLELTLEVLAALEYIHGHGVVHGDLKPANVFVLPGSQADGRPPRGTRQRPDGSSTRPLVKLLDFGLARSVRHRGGDDLGQQQPTGGGTPLYMAPEQLQGRAIDARSDLYSLGAVLYHVICGSPPFESLTSALTRKPAPRPPAALNSSCPPAVSRLILQLIAPEPAQRPRSATELAAAVREVLSPHAVAAAAPRVLRPAFVGRSAELAALRSALARATSGCGQVLRITGQRGAGKSWLLHESGLKTDAALNHGMAVWRVSLDPHHSASKGFLGLLTIDAQAHALDQDLDRERFLHACVQLVRTACRSQARLLIVEETEEASELEIEFLARICRSIAELPIALLLSYRSDSTQRRPSFDAFLRELDAGGHPAPLVLGGFSDHDLAEYVADVLSPRATASAELLEDLQQRASGGLPLTVHRRLQWLAEKGSIEVHDGEWKLEAARDPSSRDDFTADRLRDLSPPERESLAAAAILRGPFDAGAISALLLAPPPADGDGKGEGKQGLSDSLCRLVERQLLLETQDGFVVAPDLSRSDFIALLEPERRREIHRRAAGFLLAAASPTDGQLLDAAGHLVEASDRSQALQPCLQAARLASEAFANYRAKEAYALALALVEDAVQRREILCELGDFLARLGDHDGALRCYRDVEGSVAEQDRGLSMPLWDKLGRVLHRKGDLDGAARYFQRCAGEAARNALERARAQAHLAGVNFDRGQLAEARELYLSSIEVYRSLDATDHLAGAYANLGLVEKRAGETSTAIQHLESALRFAQAAGRVIEEAAILNNLGNLYRSQGDVEAALRCLTSSTERREKVGDRQGLAICLSNLSRIHVHRGDLLDALDITQRALGIFAETADQKGVLISRCNLGEILTVLGRFEAARKTLSETVVLAQRSGSALLVESSRLNLARLELSAENLPAARLHLQQVVDQTRRSSSQTLRSQVHSALAEWEIESDNLDAALVAWQEACSFARAAQQDDRQAELAGIRVRILYAQGDFEAGVREGSAALHDAGPRAERYALARLHRALALCYRDLGPDWADRTEKHFTSALAAFQAMSCPHEEAETRLEAARYWRLVGEDEAAARLSREAEEAFSRLGLGLRIERLRSRHEGR